MRVKKAKWSISCALIQGSHIYCIWNSVTSKVQNISKIIYTTHNCIDKVQFGSIASNISLKLYNTFFKHINTNLKILIIDDEPDICFLLKNILQKRELKAQYVNRLEQARQVLKEEDISIIFLDNHLPDGLGIDFLNYIKSYYAAIKVIMITAHDSPEDRNKAMQRGVDLFLSKPFTRESINAAIDHVNLA